MVKLIFGIILGFILHSGLNTLHDYKWWTTADFKCRSSNETQKCVEYNAPIISILKYPLAHVGYEFETWNIVYP